MGLYANKGSFVAQSTEPDNPALGDLWYDTVNLNLFGFNGTAFVNIGKLSFADASVITHSTTIGDYETPTGTGSQSSPVGSLTTTTPFNQTPAGAETTVGNGTVTRLGVKIDAGSSAIGTSVKKASFNLKKVGAPTGTLYLRIRNSADTILASGSMDVSTLTTSYAVYEITLSGMPIVLASGDRIVLEYSGDVSNYVNCTYNNALSSIPAGFLFTNYNGAWTDATYNMYFKFDSTPASYPYAFLTYDGDTATVWQSSAEVNPNVTVDLGSNKNICGVAIYLHANTTETTIQIKIDGVVVRTILVSALTAGAWNFIRFNIEFGQDLQVYGSSGASVVLAIAGISVLTKTDGEIFGDLGLFEISSTDTSLGLNGV